MLVRIPANLSILTTGPAGQAAAPFLLAPVASGLRDNARRQTLLEQRNQRLKLGMSEESLPREQQLAYIRCAAASLQRLHA